MKEEDYSRAIEVFSGSPWEAEIIKGLLESNDIRCVIKDGIMGTLAPPILLHLYLFWSLKTSTKPLLN